MRQEKVLFEKALIKATTIWKYTGINMNYNEEQANENIVGFFRKRWFYLSNFFCLISAALSVFGLIGKRSTTLIIFMFPCMTFSFMGGLKTFYFLYYENLVRDIIKTLRTLQSIDDSEGKEAVDDNFVKKQITFLNVATNILLFWCYMAVVTFCVGPLIITGWQFWSTNEIKLFLPYTLWYPFDEYSYVGWPFAYIHQFWSAWLAIFFVYGPDCFFYIASQFLHSQFCSLQFDMRRIGLQRDSFHMIMEQYIYRHRELIRCVEMLNVIYEKSTLYNVVASSFLICLAGFNVTAIDNLILMTPFAVFVVVIFAQIFLLCYYGDLLMRASEEVSDAVFSSEWYNLDVSSMKCCLFILMRAQKPCKIVAFGFSDINLRTFAKILSSAWSYFTLIRTMYFK